MKKLFCLFLACVLIFTTNQYTLAQETYTIKELKQKINTCEQNKNLAHEMAECARKLGYDEDCEIIRAAGERWKQENDAQKEYQALLEKRKSEYPYAHQIWDALDKKGYNDYVKAGILGNIMIETGGNTLSLNPTLYCGSYYGICQWSLYYYPAVNGLDLSKQIDYLLGNIKAKMDGFGGSGTYDRFCKLQNEREAARYFNNYYERGSGTSTRQDNATNALRYFTGG